jgi:2,3-dihydroxybenzoate decarboxylase
MVSTTAQGGADAAVAPVAGKIAVEEHVAPRELSHLITNPGWPARAWEGVLDDLADVDRRLAAMDAGGVAMAVLSLGSNGIQDVLDAGEARELARRANDALAQTVATHPDRFAGLAALPMQDPAAATEELRRTVRTLGFRGALVNGYTSSGSLDVGRYYDHRDYDPLWAALEELDVPLYLHPRNPLPGQRVIYEGREELLGPTWAFAIETGTHALRLIASGLFDRYPRLQVVLGHLGEFLPFAIQRFEQRLSRIPGVRLERAPTAVLRESFFVTTSGNYHSPSLRACLEQLGAERLLFAADYPFEVLDEGTSWFDALELEDDVKAQIGSRNAARLFGLAPPSAGTA